MEINKSLVKGSIILLFAFGIYNFFNSVFQLTMARMLSITDYGILATIFSFIYILSVFSESIQLIISKYTANEDNKGKVKNIIKKSLKKSFLISSLVFLIYLLVAIYLSDLLKIEYYLLSIGGVIIFSSFLLPVTRGVMQGKKRFSSLGINMVSESLLKLVLSILFVFIGFRVYGVIIGVIIGFIVSFVFSFYSIRDILAVKEKIVKTIGIYDYAKPAFFITLITILFYSIDIIIARIVFSPEISGMYAIASILSKSIFWGTNPISKAMFPLSAENQKNEAPPHPKGGGLNGARFLDARESPHSKEGGFQDSRHNINDKKSKNVFLNAFLILFVLIIIALTLFYFYPSFIVKIFSGKTILESANILFYLGLGTSMISLANLILIYKLSLGKIRGYYYLFIFTVIEILLLFYFSNNLFEFSIAFVTASSALLFGSIFFMND